MKTKIDIFSGFLGAGKTMLIKKLITEKFYTEKIVIIENEFGEISIDGPILKNSNVQIKEINAGCICCTVTGDFDNAITEIIEKFNPQRILIEPSGIAKLSEILDICKKNKLKDKISINMIITVIDVLNFPIYITNFGDFYKNQITNCKTIILTRTENISNETLLKLVDKIQKINSKAHIITTNLNNLTACKIVEISERTLNNIDIKNSNLLKSSSNKLIIKIKNKKTTTQPFQSFGIETAKIFSKEELTTILQKIEKNIDYGQILRVKGIVESSKNEWIQFDYVPKEISIKTFSPNYTGKISIIGTNLNKIKLKEIFLS